MRLFQRRRCVECGTRGGLLIEYATGLFVCVECAVRFGYHEVMTSVAEKVYARQTE